MFEIDKCTNNRASILHYCTTLNVSVNIVQMCEAVFSFSSVLTPDPHGGLWPCSILEAKLSGLD